MPGQIMRKQIPPDMTSEIVEFSKMTPAQRLTSIRAGLDVREITILLLCVSHGLFRSYNMDKVNMFELSV